MSSEFKATENVHSLRLVAGVYNENWWFNWIFMQSSFMNTIQEEITPSKYYDTLISYAHFI